MLVKKSLLPLKVLANTVEATIPLFVTVRNPSYELGAKVHLNPSQRGSGKTTAVVKDFCMPAAAVVTRRSHLSAAQVKSKVP